MTEGKEIPSNSLVLGVPARVVRKLTEEEIHMIEANAMEYVEELLIMLGEHKA